MHPLLLHFEQPLSVRRKLPQLNPIFCLGMTMAGLALVVPAIHSVDSRLKPVMLAA